MHLGKFVFAQIVEFIPRFEFDKCVKRYNGDFHARNLNSYNHLLQLIFGQITACTSLRDICLCLKAHQKNLYHLGIKQNVVHSTLSKANEKRDYRIFQDFGYYLINQVRPLYANEKIPLVDLENTIFALDSTSISVSINLAAWASGKYSRGAIKMHTLLDLRGSIPTFIHITDGRCHDSNVLDLLDIIRNAIYTMDKAYVDFEALERIDSKGGFFVTRANGNMKYEITSTNFNIDQSTGLMEDHMISLTGYKSKKLYPKELRLIKFCDNETGELLTFISNITNGLEFNGLEIANIYRHRWDIVSFFKLIKQNLTVKHLLGCSENAVKTHLWIAICSYLLLARIKAMYDSPYSITEIVTLVRVFALVKTDLQKQVTGPLPLIQNQDVKEPTLF